MDGLKKLGSGSDRQGSMNKTVRIWLQVFLSLFIFFVGYECMVVAFHLLNAPSDLAVYEGTGLLALLGLLVPLSLVKLWRYR
jgi:hypothetical protein